MGEESMIWPTVAVRASAMALTLTPKLQALLGDTPMPDQESGGAAVQDFSPSHSPRMLSARCVSLGLKLSFRLILASISCFLCNPLAKIPPAQSDLEGKVQDMETNAQCRWHRELIFP